MTYTLECSCGARISRIFVRMHNHGQLFVARPYLLLGSSMWDAEHGVVVTIVPDGSHHDLNFFWEGGWVSES